MAARTRLRLASIWLAATCGYVFLACALTWPLPLHFQTHLLGDTSGDLGVYVWNLWIFRHELVEHGHLPFSTDHLFAYTGGLDFALHNYTPLAGLFGVPLMGWLGLVGTFNVILLAFIALSGLGVFVLARRLGIADAAAWCAGALFIASPAMTARGSEHFSLITAAPLPLFIWALLRELDTKRIRDAALVGVLAAVATYSDAYYGIYCMLIGAFFVIQRFVRVEWRRGWAGAPARVGLLDFLMVSIGALIAWRILIGTTSLALGNIRIGLQTLYTPMLVIVVMLAVRLWLTSRPAFLLHDPDRSLRTFVSRGLIAVASCLVLLLPMIIGIGFRYAAGRLPDTETYWRSSPPGVDALAYFVPNPMHAWFGQNTRLWFASKGIVAFPEFVGSFSLVAFAAIGIAAAGRALPRMWIAFTSLAVLLSVGPFIHVAGLNTYVIGPWAILRYVPIIGMARSPSRFAVLAVLGLSLLFAFAVAALSRRGIPRWRIIGSLIAVAIAVEVTPAPRVLYSADVPDVYRLIRADGDEAGRLLELPTGVRDGTSSLGRFNAASQYFQTRHRRAMIGGYVSRVSSWRKRENRRSPVLRVIFELSERRTPSADLLERAREGRNTFLRRTCVRYVVVNKQHASNELRKIAKEILSLTLVHEDEVYQLLTPVDPPPCEPRRRRGHGPR
jgi:Predicted membrane protein (DUF2079)